MHLRALKSKIMETRRKIERVDGEYRDDRDWSGAAGLLAKTLGLDVLALVRNPEVREALEALENKTGVRRLEPVIWAAAVVYRSEDRTSLESLLAKASGKSWKGLQGFPKRIRKMAKELEALSRGDYLEGEEAKELSSLPEKLITCADSLQLQLKVARRPFRERHPPRSGWKLHLSKRIKALTGRFCDMEVARLINAVDWALNGEKSSKKGVDAQSLADLRSRRNRKAAKN